MFVPRGMLRRTSPAPPAIDTGKAEARAEIERLAMGAVMTAERRQCHDRRDVKAETLGYDIEWREHGNGRLRLHADYGDAAGAETVTVTRNEILTALNNPDAFMLALVAVSDGSATEPWYSRRPFAHEPEFGTTSVMHRIADLLSRSGPAR